MSNPHWFPSARELRQAEKYRGAGIAAEQAATALKAPVEWVRAFYAEGKR